MSKKRGVTFRAPEIDNLLAHIQAILPISSSAWERVADNHLENFPTNRRTAETLKRKFLAICRKTGPTGNPNCPNYVSHAKLIRRMIIDKTDGSTGGGSDDDNFGLQTEEDTSQDEGEEEVEEDEEMHEVGDGVVGAIDVDNPIVGPSDITAFTENNDEGVEDRLSSNLFGDCEDNEEKESGDEGERQKPAASNASPMEQEEISKCAFEERKEAATKKRRQSKHRKQGGGILRKQNLLILQVAPLPMLRWFRQVSLLLVHRHGRLRRPLPNFGKVRDVKIQIMKMMISQ